MADKDPNDEIIAIGSALVNALALAGAIALGASALLSGEAGQNWVWVGAVGFASTLLGLIATFQITAAFQKLADFLTQRFHPLGSAKALLFTGLLTLMMVASMVMVVVATFEVVNG